MNTVTTLITGQVAAYYAKMAEQYDAVYDKPEREDDLDEICDEVAEAVAGHIVLEIGCGTGFWTEIASESALSIVATDINQNLIDLAQTRDLPDEVSFRVADAYNLPDDLGEFTAILAGGWWSHVARADQEKLLAHWRDRFGKDLLVVLVDDTYVEGSSDTVARTDLEGNTYQIKTAPDGMRYEIPMNYPSDSALRKKLASSVREIKIVRLEHFWMLRCRLK
ncbi:class I SAM-dependent methyltransferase [Massilia sp. S19_KUP03_FR1]|uniref:class I SAM-dependent methyltransferase n=1 Tax=Massilia sp. S19_KUP03_FR1 TaxID=3025503 RepID=UPI002FCD4E82